MELEVIRSLADGAKDPVIGVNAKLAGVPRDAGDIVPPNVTVADSTRDAWVARRTVAHGTAAAMPALAISVYQPAPLKGEIMTVFRDGKFDVLFEYVVRLSQTERATQHGLYTMRAVLRFLAEFNKNDNVVMRQRNGIYLRVCSAIHQAPVWSEREDALVTAALIASYDVRDTQPIS